MTSGCGLTAKRVRLPDQVDGQGGAFSINALALANVYIFEHFRPAQHVAAVTSIGVRARPLSERRPTGYATTLAMCRK